MSQSLTAPSGRTYGLLRQDDQSLQINFPSNRRSMLLWSLGLIAFGIGVVVFEYDVILNFFNTDVIVPFYETKFIFVGLGCIVFGFLLMFVSSQVLLSSQGITNRTKLFGIKISDSTIPFDQIERIGLEKGLDEKGKRTNEDVILIYAQDGYAPGVLTLDGFADVQDRTWFMGQLTQWLIEAGCPEDIASPREAQSQVQNLADVSP